MTINIINKNIKKSLKKSTYTTISFLSMQEVLPFLGKPGKMFFSDCKFKIKTSGLRLKIFTQQTDCSCCDLKGSFFAIQKDKNNKKLDKPYSGWHLNLYGINSLGEAVIMTRDHIYPKSMGGEETLANSQTMCINCNSAKDNYVPLPLFGVMAEREMQKFIKNGENPYDEQE